MLQDLLITKYPGSGCVGIRVDSCRALDAFVRGCFWLVFGAVGRGGGGDERWDGGELSGIISSWGCPLLGAQCCLSWFRSC